MSCRVDELGPPSLLMWSSWLWNVMLDHLLVQHHLSVTTI